MRTGRQALGLWVPRGLRISGDGRECRTGQSRFPWPDCLAAGRTAVGTSLAAGKDIRYFDGLPYVLERAIGWGKSDLRQFLFDHAVRTREELAAAGKEAVSSRTRWRLPADHPGSTGPVRPRYRRRVGLEVRRHRLQRLARFSALVMALLAGRQVEGGIPVEETVGP